MDFINRNKKLKDLFRNIPNIKTSKALLDLAFRRASKKKKIESKINVVRDITVYNLSRTIKNFPSIDHLPDFYKELLDKRIGITKLKRALSKVNASIKIIDSIAREARANLDRKEIKKHFYGRISSVINNLAEELDIIKKAGKELNSLPIIDPEIFTVAITGFPNVGKTTILNLLSGSNAKVGDYPFTTKHINVGVLKHNLTTIQLLDTPGCLSREKKNPIEEEAIIAMKSASHAIVFVFDPFLGVEDQLKLFYDFKKKVPDKEFIVFISKGSLPEVEEETKKKINENIISSQQDLIKELIKRAKSFYRDKFKHNSQ